MRYPKSRATALSLGRTYYKTGKLCTRGHKSKRYVRNGRCVDCDRLITQKRRTAIIERTPPWADLSAIKGIYSMCRKMGKEYHVDHVIPLLGENVSGLHTHNNLIIRHKSENLKKGRSFSI